MVEENGTSGAGPTDPLASASSSAAATAPHVVAVTSIVQLTLPTQAPTAQVFILFIIYINTDKVIVMFTCCDNTNLSWTCCLHWLILNYLPFLAWQMENSDIITLGSFS